MDRLRRPEPDLDLLRPERAVICYDPNGLSISGYATWDQLSSGQWVYDGLMNTPPGGPTGLPRCADYPPNL